VRLLEADLGPGVRAGFTRRRSGVSTGPYAGLNLAQHVGDDVEPVAANRAALAAWAGAPVVFARQVHGVRVLTVGGPDGVPPPPDPRREDVATEDGCDALVTRGPQLALGVLVADCVPVLLADPEAAVVGVAHVGRVGLLAGVLAAVLGELTRAGAVTERLRVALGPSAGPCCYEVPERMRADAVRRIPAVGATTTWGTPALDLRAGCRSLLADRVAQVSDVGGCTIEDEESFSYRRTPRTGRLAGVVRLLP